MATPDYTHLRELLERYRHADSRMESIDAWEDLSSASFLALPALLDRLDALERDNFIKAKTIANLRGGMCLCPDCRDKVKPGECPRCAQQTAERKLSRALDYIWSAK